MKKFQLIFCIIITFVITASAQTNGTKPKRHLTESTIVRDSAGTVYPYETWKKMVASGLYRVRAIDPGNDSTAYILLRLDSAQQTKRMDRILKPKQSLSFINGDTFRPFSATDIKDYKIDLNELKGKIVVINFLYIKGEHTLEEIPDLNKIALQYAIDPGIVFIAIFLDKQRDIEDFLAEHPFNYHIIENGRIYAKSYGLERYPVNVVLDKAGIIKFNSQGYKLNTGYWIQKTIEELK